MLTQIDLGKINGIVKNAVKTEVRHVIQTDVKQIVQTEVKRAIQTDVKQVVQTEVKIQLDKSLFPVKRQLNRIEKSLKTSFNYLDRRDLWLMNRLDKTEDALGLPHPPPNF